MSLQGAVEEERKLIDEILKRRAKGQLLGDDIRNGERREKPSRSATRGLSRSMSRLSRASSTDANDNFLITSRDPSLRLDPNYRQILDEVCTPKAPEMPAYTSLINPKKPAEAEEEAALRREQEKLENLSSEEEQISDTDNEFEIEDDGSVLPNYAGYSELMAASPAASPSPKRGLDVQLERRRAIEVVDGEAAESNGAETAADEEVVVDGEEADGVVADGEEVAVETEANAPAVPTAATGAIPTAIGTTPAIVPPTTTTRPPRPAIPRHSQDGSNRYIPPVPTLNSMTTKDDRELRQIHNRKLVKDAIRAEKLDELVAIERARENALFTGEPLEAGFDLRLTELAHEARTGFHENPEQFYKKDPRRKEKLKEYAKYKKKLTSPQVPGDNFAIPYTSDIEEKIDQETARMLNEKIDVSEIESDLETQRTIRTVTRGNFFENMAETGQKSPRSFVLCVDFSDESHNALEWCIGTALTDGCVLYLLNVLEDEEYSSMELNGIQPKNKKSQSSNKKALMGNVDRARIRRSNVEHLTRDVLKLIKLTKLQVHVVIQSSHHPIPRHFILLVIKHISPTMVVVGSKGRSAIKGVILGSLSNYLVRKSTAPVMVVKYKLKKLIQKGTHEKKKEYSPLHPLSEAHVD